MGMEIVTRIWLDLNCAKEGGEMLKDEGEWEMQKNFLCRAY